MWQRSGETLVWQEQLPFKRLIRLKASLARWTHRAISRLKQLWSGYSAGRMFRIGLDGKIPRSLGRDHAGD
jgi:hypothetical protein